ncbi:MAG: BREX system Lon protease-like protein BrxL [Christensenellales bacterium]
MEEKLKLYFDGMIVKKSSIQGVFSTLSLPAFIRDWFIKRYSDKNGDISVDFVTEKIKDIIPRKNEWNAILDKIMTGEKAKFMAKINVSFDIKTGRVNFALPDFGVTTDQTYISATVWETCKKSLLRTDGDIWGIIELGYGTVQVSAKKEEGRILLTSFKDFLPYSIDINYYRNARKYFDLDEWIDLLLMAIDYNPSGYNSHEEKIMMLTRLLPFVEKRLNLIELAPKGTGKSYVFSQISKRGWLSSGGVMTRAKLLYDMKSKQEGLVANYDYVALDEVGTIKFPDEAEMQGAMKGYLESGSYTVGVKAGNGDAGIVLLGNIKSEMMNVNVNMFENLPAIFGDSALIDRFHGFIEGWKIPRMNENMKADGWALNTEYFAEILHAFRDDVVSKTLVENVLIVPKDADTRDTTAVKKIMTAFTKLLFPHWQKPQDVDFEKMQKYCLDPAMKMRNIIKKQLAIIDVEYRNKPMADYRLIGYNQTPPDDPSDKDSLSIEQACINE